MFGYMIFYYYIIKVRYGQILLFFFKFNTLLIYLCDPSETSRTIGDHLFIVSKEKRIIARPMTVPSSVFENWSQADTEKATMGAKGGRKLNIYTVFQKSRYTAY